jgi:Mitochondrial small ribosomal subunit Rsm22
MNLAPADWANLQRLRDKFLEPEPQIDDYWDSVRTLELYDQTFGLRIGWKWDAVLEYLERIRWNPGQGTIIDWGCGTGIAARLFAQRYPNLNEVRFVDRSTVAAKFAQTRFQTDHPTIPSGIGLPSSEGFCLLVSHVLNELDSSGENQLRPLFERAQTVIWVEPGTRATSRRLNVWRDEKRSEVVAPCTHSGPCGMLQRGNDHDWCHFFAQPPRSIFIDSDWSEFSRRLEIDLRSLPYSYFVSGGRCGVQLRGYSRVLGTVRVYKPVAKLQLCSADGIQDIELTRRANPEGWRRYKKGDGPDLVRVELATNRITAWDRQLPT